MSDEEMDIPDDVDIPSFKAFSIDEIYDYMVAENDYASLEDLNANIANARISLFKVAENMNIADRKSREARVAYERALNREYLKSSGRTAADRKAYASIKCEHLENQCLYYEQAERELGRFMAALRLELQTLQSIGNNLRQQMKMEE